MSASRHWYTGEFSTMSVIVFVDAEMKLNTFLGCFSGPDDVMYMDCDIVLATKSCHRRKKCVFLVIFPNLGQGIIIMTP